MLSTYAKFICFHVITERFELALKHFFEANYGNMVKRKNAKNRRVFALLVSYAGLSVSSSFTYGFLFYFSLLLRI